MAIFKIRLHQRKKTSKPGKMRQEDERARSPVRTIEMMDQINLLLKECEQETWSIVGFESEKNRKTDCSYLAFLIIRYLEIIFFLQIQF